MPLLIDFKSGDKVIINGAVIENGGGNTKILLHNKAAVLRSKEVLTEEEAQTPATRTYFDLQAAYIFSDQKEEHLNLFWRKLRDYVAACPSAQPIVDEIEADMKQDNLYKALKNTQKLIIHESELLQGVEADMRRIAEEFEKMQDQDKVT